MAKDEQRPPPETGSNTPADDECNPCFWKKLEILGRPISASLMTAAVAILGWWGQQSISEITQIEQNARLYTELLSRREESESALRKDMFNTILGDFFAAKNGDGDNETPCYRDIDQRLLKFELLVLNFSESLSISPIFSELKKDINSRCSYKEPSESEGRSIKDHHNKRLRALAKRIAARQVAALLPKGKTLTIGFERADMGADNQYEWPAEAPEPRAEACLSLPRSGVARLISLLFSEASAETETVKVELNINSMVWKGPADETPADLCEAIHKVQAAPSKGPSRFAFEEVTPPNSFTLDYYNFPLIDNTLLSKDQRLAVILEHIDKVDEETGEALESPYYWVRVLVFPGQYSSRRDTPVLTDVLEQLRKSTASEMAGWDSDDKQRTRLE